MVEPLNSILHGPNRKVVYTKYYLKLSTPSILLTLIKILDFRTSFREMEINLILLRDISVLNFLALLFNPYIDL